MNEWVRWKVEDEEDAVRRRPTQGHTHDKGMSLGKGDEVEVITNSGAGQLVVAVNGTRLALGRGIAKKIIVKPNGIRKG